ncbi:MAG TPA: DUF554 domain-containing protein [Acidimicrobiales bacterium]|nr:DUF554 domain-containing protein [Acidimicrobiales bacterium]
MPGLGTAINVATIVAGTGAGLLVGGRIPERARATVLQSVGLVTLALGVGQAIRTDNIVFPLVAVVVGGLLGEALRIEDRLEAFGDRIRRRVERDVDVEVEGFWREPVTDSDREPLQKPAAAGSTFVEGFVAASLLFCVGPLAILGSISDGLEGDVGVLVVKAALDGLVSVVFAATLGWGVGFSVLPVLVYQGLLTLLAGSADAVLTDRMILEGTATGGIMVMGIALRLLDLKAVRVGSLLPGLLLAPALVAVFAR